MPRIRWNNDTVRAYDLSSLEPHAFYIGATSIPQTLPGLERENALYIPSLWWHQVESLGTFNVLINYWWEQGVANTGSPFEAMVHSLLTIRHLPLEKRRAWQTFFEHYIFDDENPAAHMRPEQRRALNDMRPELAEYLKGFLRSAINKPS